ncbi:MAG: type II toxin-antitoxin system RelE/ParE family toxin [Armatimonadetes bacterium]|nr:type II toxin-antitoxin system RelE/ParE family toxin [Armatimonadota bacterium]
MHSLILSRQAERTLDRVDRVQRERLLIALRELQRDPFNRTLDIRPVAGEPGVRRLRVGGWRVLFVIYEARREVAVLRILPRGEACKR